MAKAAKKSNVVELKGHNSNKEEDDRKVLFFMDRNAYVKALEAKKAADAAFKNVCKTIKSDLGEHGLAQIKLYEQARTPEGEAKIKARMEAERQAARWAGLAVNTQADLFDADLAPIDDRAYAEGEEAGLRGDTLANPFDVNSKPGRRFEEGWKAGQASLAEGFRKKADGDELISGAGDDVFEEEGEE